MSSSEEETEGLLFIPGAFDAVAGVVRRCGQDPFVVYDHDLLIRHFMQEGMSALDAEEWISYNIIGAWVGNGTPGVIERLGEEYCE